MALSTASSAAAASAGGAREGAHSCGVPHGAVTPLRPRRLGELLPAASSGEVCSVSVELRARRTPHPHSALPPLLTSDVEHCGGGSSPAPWQPSLRT